MAEYVHELYDGSGECLDRPECPRFRWEPVEQDEFVHEAVLRQYQQQGHYKEPMKSFPMTQIIKILTNRLFSRDTKGFLAGTTILDCVDQYASTRNVNPYTAGGAIRNLLRLGFVEGTRYDDGMPGFRLTSNGWIVSRVKLTERQLVQATERWEDES
jgi:hypothetical protein